MHITATTKNDYAAVRALTIYQLCRKHRPRNVALLFGIVFGLAYALFFYNTFVLQLSAELPYLLLLFFVIPACLFLLFLLPRITYRNMKQFRDMENRYTFTETELVAESDIDRATMPYQMLNEVSETDRYFFFWLHRGSAFVVDKTTLVGGTADDVRTAVVLHARKYIRCRY